MAQQLFSPVNAFIQGRAAAQQYRAGEQRNALAQMEIDNAPAQMQRRNRLGELQVEGAEMGIDAERAKVGYARLKQALDSGDPKSYVLQREPELVAKLQQQGVDLASVDDQTAARIIDGFAREYAGKAGIAPAAPQAFTLKPGEARYVGDQVVAERPKLPGEDSGFTLSPGQTRYGPDGKPIASSAAKADPSQTFDIESKLRGEYNAQSKEFIGIANSYQRILDSASDPSAAGDLALIFNYMKVLDPGSTVREGEFANAEAAGSVPARIVAQYNKVLSGERLAADQRADIVKRATTLYKGQEARHNRIIRTRYEELAKRAGVKPENVIVDINAATPAGSGGVPEFATEAEAEAAGLAPGTRVIIGGVPGTWQ